MPSGAVVAVVTSSPPGVEGGHLVVARSLVQALRESGREAALVVTHDFGFGKTFNSYRENWRTDVAAVAGRPVDQVISLRYPSFAVRHPKHVSWLNHTMREYYDLWSHFSSTISSRARVKETMRKTGIRAADWWLLHFNVTRVFAQSRTVQGRLRADLGVTADVLWPPPPQRPYRCDEYGDFVFAISRLTPHKRLDLLIRALAEPPARGVRAVIAGDGESRAAWQQLAASLGVANRVTFAGQIDDARALDYLARCRAVCYPPYAEDYGFVTVEAFAARKPVVTCRDSGGPTELVVDRRSGLIAEPTPASIAAALAEITADRSLAERMGAEGAALAASLTWEHAVKTLVMV
jgi:glycosyltransferase involved in cell wall biosynthesis